MASTTKLALGLFATSLIPVITVIGASTGAAAPEGQMTWGVHISLAPTWFDRAETPGIAAPFMVRYRGAVISL